MLTELAFVQEGACASAFKQNTRLFQFRPSIFDDRSIKRYLRMNSSMFTE